MDDMDETAFTGEDVVNMVMADHATLRRGPEAVTNLVATPVATLSDRIRDAATHV